MLYRGSSSILVSGKSVLLSLFPAAASASLILLSISYRHAGNLFKTLQEDSDFESFQQVVGHHVTLGLLTLYLWRCAPSSPQVTVLN